MSKWPVCGEGSYESLTSRLSRVVPVKQLVAVNEIHKLGDCSFWAVRHSSTVNGVLAMQILRAIYNYSDFCSWRFFQHYSVMHVITVSGFENRTALTFSNEWNEHIQ